jgi:hypothetical protein
LMSSSIMWRTKLLSARADVLTIALHSGRAKTAPTAFSRDELRSGSNRQFLEPMDAPEKYLRP